MIEKGDRYKHRTYGRVFTVSSIDSRMVILMTEDKSHSIITNPEDIESTFMPFTEEEKKNYKVKN